MPCKSSILVTDDDLVTSYRCADCQDIKCNGTPADKAECWRWSGGLEKQTFIKKIKE